MQLNKKQSYAFTQISMGKNLFITGPGGVGKSVLIHKIKEMFEDDTVFLAPTGIAAQNIKGSTIHRTFKFPIGFLGHYQRTKVSKKAENIFGNDVVKRIVIDEISMVRADLFTAVDQVLRRVKKRNKPFGGIQVIVVGDFFQLPPVLNNSTPEGKYFLQEFSSPFAFDCDSWNEAGFETIELDQVMRQSDSQFINALNSIRQKDKNYAKNLDFLNNIGNKSIEVDEPLFLCSTNKDAETINQHHYEEVEGEEKLYTGVVDKQFKDFPVPISLYLKEGCKVLICANSQGDSEFFNGQTGVVTSLHDDYVMVQLDGDDYPTKVDSNTWEEYDYDVVDGILNSSVVGTYRQLPIKLGYAVTIHKSQGLSLDNAVIYTGRGCFTHGQAYVALSRLRSLQGLHMMQPVSLSEIIVDQRVRIFYEHNKTANLMNM